MILKDSGERREFKTGAVRDRAIGKGRCDLLPLDIIAEWTGCVPLLYIYDYIHKGHVASLYDALDKFVESVGMSKVKATLHIAKHYERGAMKYGERNWEQGLPVSWYIDSGVRHMLQYLDGATDEPHADAFMWNIIGAVWTHKHFPELRDLPFADKEVVHD